jgi:LPS-assembly protein
MANAQDQRPECGLNGEIQFMPEFKGDVEESVIEIESEQAELIEDGTSVFTGNVDVQRANQSLNADRATYNQTSGEIHAYGDVIVRDSEMIVEGDQAEWLLNQDRGTLNDAQYQLKDINARGIASKAIREGRDTTHLDDATYTTCPRGDNAWLLQADKVDLDHVAAVGVARNALLRVAGIPVLYTPYFSFPLNDERKSGFLTPSIGVTDETGFDLMTPYYWNIDPRFDATISPRYMSDRGLLVNAEFRYLYEQGEGIIDSGYLNNDNLNQTSNGEINPYYNQARKHFYWKNSTQFATNWRANLDYSYVSDNDYLEDFSRTLSLASTTHLNRDINVSYSSYNWNFLARAQSYQTLTSATEPYKRLPQLKLNGELPDQAYGLTYGLDSELVYFDHDTKVNGSRFNFEPSISLPLEYAAGFIKPRIALNHTRYDLTDNLNVGAEEQPTRTLPILSLDTGLFFERELMFADTGYIQTLEPRVFYLYVPEREQLDIPTFDAGLKEFRFSELFAHNRFSGSDRVGDANQVTLAVTTRFLNQDTGREKFNFTLGQIRYFSDRRVNISGNNVATEDHSDLVAQLTTSLTDHWKVRGEVQWDQNDKLNNLSALELSYKSENGGVFNMSHRYRRDDIEQVDISTFMPLNKQWSLVGRWYRSLQDRRTLEGLAGIEYQSCCWSTRFVVRNYVNDINDDERNVAFFLQFELKGLGKFGQKSDDLLSKSIKGYGL